MPIYAIALKVQEDATAAWRHQAALQAIRANARFCWDEAASLVLIESGQPSSREVAAGVLDEASLSGSKDVMVVINLDSGDHFILGHLTEAGALEALLRRLGHRADPVPGEERALPSALR